MTENNKKEIQKVPAQPITANSKGLVLRNIEDMYRFAKYVVASKDLAPSSFKTPEAILVAIQSGAELGLSYMQSLKSIAVINGRSALWGDAALGLVKASGLCEYVHEWIEGKNENMTAYCETKRKDESEPLKTDFSVEDAKRAKLWGKTGTWQAYPKRMLKYRARGFNLRDNFPDVLCGFHIAEEMIDVPPEPAYEPTTPKRADRKPIDAIVSDLSDLDVAMQRYGALQGESDADKVAIMFKEFCWKLLGGELEHYEKPDVYSSESLEKIFAELDRLEAALNNSTAKHEPELTEEEVEQNAEELF